MPLYLTFRLTVSLNQVSVFIYVDEKFWGIANVGHPCHDGHHDFDRRSAVSGKNRLFFCCLFFLFFLPFFLQVNDCFLLLCLLTCE